MNDNILIIALKSQIENMKLQIDNIEMQNNNILLMNNPKGDQLLNLSIQLFNSGIQAFNAGKNTIVMNKVKFYEQLKNISEQINIILNANFMESIQQQMTIQQQIMPQQQQMMMQQKIKNKKEQYINIGFDNCRKHNVNLAVKYGTTIEELLNKYINEVYGITNKKLNFIFNAKRLERNDQNKVEQFFQNFSRIIVTEIDY